MSNKTTKPKTKPTKKKHEDFCVCPTQTYLLSLILSPGKRNVLFPFTLVLRKRKGNNTISCTGNETFPSTNTEYKKHNI